MTTRETARSLDDAMPGLTYRDLSVALGLIASGPDHRAMIPYLVSALREQAPYLTGQMTMFEILRSANCLADIGSQGTPDG
ncbi:hypothetical protein [Brevundimonas variabilis]|uniref:Uncharacterized protein n=1 Tax=Brevundimonas variabilis TaxID=74312 RepID=A0A7W9FED1_9CAUL|nr:hypothetical protein [Brevundimonas variabilis]MBB5746170.1 hypothetical protein [Brevundimonas variabilis]